MCRPSGVMSCFVSASLVLCWLCKVSGQGLAPTGSTRDKELGACNKYGNCAASSTQMYLAVKQFQKRWQTGGPKAACASQRSQLVTRPCALADGANRELALQVAQLVLATSPARYNSADSKYTGGLSIIAPAGNQGDCSSCTAFAVIAAARAAVARVLRVPVDQVQLSVHDLFFCSQDDPRRCTSPWSIPAAVKQLSVRQLLQPECMPYVPTTGLVVSQKKQCSAKCQKRSALAAQGSFDFNRVSEHWEALGHIMAYGGVLSRFDIYDDFKPFFSNKANADKVYRPGPKAKLETAHAIFIVGYDMENQYWLAQNSWSASWADGGFFKVAFGCCAVLEPGATEAYAVFWQPTASTAVAKAKLAVTQAPQSGCCLYKAVAGDYLPVISMKSEIPMPVLLANNTDRIGKVLDAPLAGKTLMLCGPASGSIAVQQGPGPAPPAAKPAVAPPAVSPPATKPADAVCHRRKLMATHVPSSLDRLAYNASAWRRAWTTRSSRCSCGPESLC